MKTSGAGNSLESMNLKSSNRPASPIKPPTRFEWKPGDIIIVKRGDKEQRKP